jgi:hypothetical protein
MLSGIPAMVVCMRLLHIRASELLDTLGAPAAAAGFAGVALLASVLATQSVRPLPALVVVAAAGIGGYVLGSYVFTRGILVAMWTNARAGA